MTEFQPTPVWPHTFKVGSSPGWTPDAYAGDALVDSAGQSWPIYGNTADAMFLNPSAHLGAPKTGAWRVVDPLNPSVTVIDSGTYSGTVTVTTGAANVTESTYSIAFSTRALTSVSFQITVTGSSPKGTLTVRGSNNPDTQAGAINTTAEGAPANTDASWTGLPIVADGVTLTNGVLPIGGTGNHVIQVATCFRWMDLLWTPDGSPGTGAVTAKPYGYGPM